MEPALDMLPKPLKSSKIQTLQIVLAFPWSGLPAEPSGLGGVYFHC